MIKLYHSTDTRSFRALWTLQEMQLPYELVTLPFPPRTRVKSYRDVNPLGTVPYMIDGRAHMTESAAICHYLARRYGPSELALTVEETDYPIWLNALYQSDATLTFPLALVFRYSTLEPPERRQPQVVEDYARWFLARLRWLDARLIDNEYVAANRFTVADVAVGYALKLADLLGVLTTAPERIRKYWDRLTARDGYARTMAVQEWENSIFLEMKPDVHFRT